MVDREEELKRASIVSLEGLAYGRLYAALHSSAHYLRNFAGEFPLSAGYFDAGGLCLRTFLCDCGVDVAVGGIYRDCFACSRKLLPLPAELKFTVRSSGPESGLPLATTVGFWLALTVIVSVWVSVAPSGSVTVSVAVKGDPTAEL